MADWLKKAVVRYDQRRNEDKRNDMAYLTAQQREKHICNTREQTDSFLQTHLAKADAKSSDEYYVLVLDIEKPPNQRNREFSWHERELVRQGVTKAEIEERWRNRESVKRGSDRKGAARKVSGYWRHREEDRLDGIADATVAAFAIAAAEDEDGTNTFAVHVGNVVGRNKTEMPPALLQLLCHRAVVWINVNQYDDIGAMATTFYDDPKFRNDLCNIKYVEAEQLFLKTWGEGWNGKDKDGKLRPTNGVLNILEHANKGFTMLKHPMTTNSNWLAPKWSIAQKRYTLEDVEFLSLAVRGVLLHEEKQFLRQLIYCFPERKLGESAKKGPYYGPTSIDSSKQTNLLGFTTTLESSDEEQEAGARFKASQLNERRAAERVAAAKYSAAAAKIQQPTEEPSTSASSSAAAAAAHAEEETSKQGSDEATEEMCVYEEDILEVGVSATEKSAVTGEAVEEQEDNIEEIVRLSLPPFRNTGSKVVYNTLRRPRDAYEAMEVVEHLPGAEKVLKRARPVAPYVQETRIDYEVCTGPSPYISMITTDLNEATRETSTPRLPTPTHSLPIHSPPPLKRHRPADLKGKDSIILRPLTTQQQKQLNHLKRLLSKNFSNTGQKMLLNIDAEVRPEMLGEIFSEIQPCKKNGDTLRETMKFWEAQFSTNEKERFLKSVGKKTNSFGMVTWFDLICYDRFDVLMFISRSRHERKEEIRRNLRRLTDGVDEALQQLVEWRKGSTCEILSILRNSKFISPALESALYPFVKPDCFDDAIEVICQYFWRPFPKPLSIVFFPSSMHRLVSASRQWEMSEKTVVRLVKWMVGDDVDLKEGAEVLMEEAAWAGLIWNKDEKYAATTLPCWEKLNSVHAEKFRVIRVNGSNASVATSRLKDEKGPVTISYRLLNDPRFPKCLSVVMWQLPGSDEKFWLSVSRKSGGSDLEVMDALLGADLVLVDLNHFSEAVNNCLHKTPKTERIARGTLKGGRGHILQRLAKDRRMTACLATSSRPIVDERDLDDCFIWHMAHEVDLLVNRK